MTAQAKEQKAYCPPLPKQSDKSKLFGNDVARAHVHLCQAGALPGGCSRSAMSKRLMVNPMNVVAKAKADIVAKEAVLDVPNLLETAPHPVRLNLPVEEAPMPGKPPVHIIIPKPKP